MSRFIRIGNEIWERQGLSEKRVCTCESLGRAEAVLEALLATYNAPGQPPGPIVIAEVKVGAKALVQDNASREWLETHDDGGLQVSARNPEIFAPMVQQDDIAEIATYNNLDLALLTSELVKRMIQCLRECAMEAEIGHELGGFRVTLLQRYGLTDGSDPAFGPVKYPHNNPKPEEPLF